VRPARSGPRRRHVPLPDESGPTVANSGGTTALNGDRGPLRPPAFVRGRPARPAPGRKVYGWLTGA